jgi:GT2 family glycosyltransferase
MEEIDLCWRFKNRGYRIVFTPDSRVYHVGGGTLEYSNPRKLYLNFRNNLWLLYKNLPAHQLFYILFTRMVLDFVAATKLLGEFNFYGIKSVMKAHLHFYESLPALDRKRKEVVRNQEFSKPIGMLSKSIVFQFYIRKKRKFSEIKF